ncbi:MAG TPA: hypothetical protein PKK94_17020, partial [Leptospiraceae bacterium]|nr:hypothetical protein [Leptospiraceae bacterium]
FTSNTVNNGGASANTLNNPLGITLDKTGNLYVADYYNNRVLYYIPGSTTASRVYGQFGSFTSTVGGNDGNGSTLAPSASNLYYPTSVSIDPSGNLYIAEQVDNRVLLFY